MRKVMAIVLALVCMVTLLVGCGIKTEQGAIPLEQLSGSYNLENAKADNCVVFEDLDITSGQEVWDDFVAESKNGNSASVRLAFYYTLGDPSKYGPEYYAEIKDDYPILNISDLSFDGEKYSIATIEDGELYTQEYLHLVKYEGKPNSATAIYSAYTYYVLVNDDSVTWDDIEHGMTSSLSGDYIDHYMVYSDYTLK